jgi:hypothetical protein
MNKSQIDSLAKELITWGNAASHYLVKQICIMNNWPYGEIWTPSDDLNFMTWKGYWTSSENYFEKLSKFSSLHKFAPGIGLIGKTWEYKKMFWIGDITHDNSFLRTEVAINCGLNSCISIPLLHEDEIFCILCFFINKLSDNEKKKALTIFEQSQEFGKLLSESI